MAADERLMDPIRRFWPDRSTVEANYLSLFTADWAKVQKMTLIVQKNSESEGATAQVIVKSEERFAWMEAFAQRLAELDAAAAGTTPLVPGCTTVDFSGRFVET